MITIKLPLQIARALLACLISRTTPPDETAEPAARALLDGLDAAQHQNPRD
jgi:hypothetical protein